MSWRTKWAIMHLSVLATVFVGLFVYAMLLTILGAPETVVRLFPWIMAAVSMLVPFIHYIFLKDWRIAFFTLLCPALWVAVALLRDRFPGL